MRSLAAELAAKVPEASVAEEAGKRRRRPARDELGRAADRCSPRPLPGAGRRAHPSRRAAAGPPGSRRGPAASRGDGQRGAGRGRPAAAGSGGCSPSRATWWPSCWRPCRSRARGRWVRPRAACSISWSRAWAASPPRPPAISCATSAAGSASGCSSTGSCSAGWRCSCPRCWRRTRWSSARRSVRPSCGPSACRSIPSPLGERPPDPTRPCGCRWCRRCRPGTYEALGYPVIGELAVRADELERIGKEVGRGAPPRVVARRLELPAPAAALVAEVRRLLNDRPGRARPHHRPYPWISRQNCYSAQVTDPQELLRERFGFAEFRPGQREVLQALSSGARRWGCSRPAGASRCVTSSRRCSWKGVTLVVSPLIALMKDQIDFLQARGIPASRLDSSLSAAEAEAVVAQLRAGALKLLYVAPERFNNERFLAMLATTQHRPVRRGRGPLHLRVGPQLSPRLPQAGGDQPAGAGRAGAGADRHRHPRGGARTSAPPSASPPRCAWSPAFIGPT